jgi:hypothetical protein
MLIRTTIVVLAYLLSSFGLLLMLQLIAEELRSVGNPNPFIFIWLAAWAVHLVMSIAWIRNTRLPRAWPIAGIFLSLASFLIWPFTNSDLRETFGPEIAISVTLQFLITQLVVVSPCIVLAIKLLFFHLKPVAKSQMTSKYAA